jgi:predicted membrane protein
MNDDLKDLADAGVEVLGDIEEVLEPHFRPGNWLLLGGAIAVIAMATIHMGPWWTLAVAFIAGTAANEWERQQIKARLKARRDAQ